MSTLTIVLLLSNAFVCVMLLLACLKIEEARDDAWDEAMRHEECHERVLDLLSSVDHNRTSAAALDRAAEAWEDPANQPFLSQLAREKYQPGGPSMPAIWLRDRAEVLRSSLKSELRCEDPADSTEESNV